MFSLPAAGVPDSIERIVRLAQRGDEAAFSQIVRLHHADMVRVAYLVCGDLDIAEDGVASAWPLAWRRLPSLRDPERLRPWLCSIAANEARQILRNQRRRTVREIAVSRDETAAGDPAAGVGDLDLAAALAKLGPEDRALLALRYVAGLNSSELGRALGRSPSGTRARLGRLLERLRKELGDV